MAKLTVIAALICAPAFGQYSPPTGGGTGCGSPDCSVPGNLAVGGAAAYAGGASFTPKYQTGAQSTGNLVLNAQSATIDTWFVSALTQSVTSFTVNNQSAGQETVFRICQAAAGGPYTVSSPTGYPPIPVSPYPAVCVTSAFLWNGSTAVALAAPTSNGTPGICPEVAAPSSNPPPGTQYDWCDSTTHTHMWLDSSGNTYMAPLAKASRTANQFVTNIPSSGIQQVAAIAAADIPAVSLPTPGATCTLAANSTFCICTTTCTVTVPVPAAGYQFCIANDDNVSTVITLSAIGSSARYENTARTAYGTAGTGTLVSGGAVKDSVCIFGRDSTHYLTLSSNGTWTAN